MSKEEVYYEIDNREVVDVWWEILIERGKLYIEIATLTYIEDTRIWKIDVNILKTGHIIIIDEDE